MLKKILLALLLVCVPSWAQSQILQSGTVTPGHPVQWTTNGVVQDGGTPAAGTLSGVGVTFPVSQASAANAFCANSGPLAGGWNALCLGVGLSGNAYISLQNFGTATAQGLDFIINGVKTSFNSAGLFQPFSTTLSGIVNASGSGTCFIRGDNTCATPAGGGNVSSVSVSSVTNDFPQFSDTTGTNIKDGGLSPTNASDTKVVMAHGAFTATHCLEANDTAGTAVDSGGTCGIVSGTGITVAAGVANLSVLPPPQGRLTLTTGTPVMNADATAQTTVYYDTYVGNQVPVYNGTAWVYYTITSDEISLALDSNSGHTGYQASGSLFDIFAGNNGGITLCTGPAWGTTTSRGTGAGTTQISRLNGIYVNTVSMTCRDGTGAGSTFVCAVNECTYLGTMYATANGQTGMQFRPDSAAGGSNTIMALYNAYNRVKMAGQSRDSTSTWTYATATWRSANASTSNRVTYIDGLGFSPVDATYDSTISVSGSVAGIIAVNQDSTSAVPVTNSEVSTAQNVSAFVRDNLQASLGLHYIQAMEFATGATVTYAGGNLQSLLVSLDM